MKKDLLNSPTYNYCVQQNVSKLMANPHSFYGPDSDSSNSVTGYLNEAIEKGGGSEMPQDIGLGNQAPPYNQTIANKIIADRKLAYDALLGICVSASDSAKKTSGGIEELVATTSCGRPFPPPVEGGGPSS